MNRSPVHTVYRWIYRKTAFWRDFTFFGWHRQVYYYLKYKNQQKKHKFIFIYCDGRTGSTLLGESLARHPSIIYNQEVLRKKVFHFPSFLRGHGSKNCWLVVKIKPMNLKLQGIEFRQMMDFFKKNDSYYIYLKRQNLFRQAVSNLLAKERQQYHIKHESERHQSKSPLRINDLVRKYEALKELQMAMDADLALFSFHHLTYEAHLAEHNALLQAVNTIISNIGYDELELPDSRIKKVLPLDLSGQFIHWPEIKSYMVKHQLE